MACNGLNGAREGETKALARAGRWHNPLFRVEDAGKDLDTIDQTRARTIEVRRAVDNEHPVLFHGLELEPRWRERSSSHLLQGALKAESAGHSHNHFWPARGDLLPAELARWLAEHPENVLPAGDGHH